MDWNEFFIVGLLALCVLGPILVVLLTQNFLDSADDVTSEHFDFDAVRTIAPLSKPPLEDGPDKAPSSASE